MMFFRSKRTVMRSAFSLTLASFLLFSCKPKEPEPQQINPAFTSYISAFSNGVISNSSKIQIHLTSDFYGGELGMIQENKLFKFEPEIEGRTRWINPNVIEFIPSETLNSNSAYQANFHLGALMNIDPALEHFKFQFRTRQQNVSVSVNNISLYSKKDLEHLKINGSITLADFTTREALEKSFSAKKSSEEYTLVWDYQEQSLVQNFRIDSIKKSDDASTLDIAWEQNSLLNAPKGNYQIAIAAKNDFKILTVNKYNNDDQYVQIIFSEPLNPKQDLTGLITLGGNNFRIEKNDNSINIYPSSRLKGTFQLQINQAISNINGIPLKEQYAQTITFENLKPAVELIGSGNILPTSSGLTLPFKAVNLNAIVIKVLRVEEERVPYFMQKNTWSGTQELTRFGRLVHESEVPLVSDKNIDLGTWNNFSIDLSSLMEPELGAFYRVQLSFKSNHSLYPCQDEEKVVMLETLAETERDKRAKENHYDKIGDWYGADFYYSYPSNYQYYERDNPCKAAYYQYDNATVEKNIIASNFGMIAKSGSEGKMHVIITDLKTAEPLNNVSVEAFNVQNQSIGKTNTNRDGFAVFKPSGKAFYIKASQGKDKGFLKVAEGNSLSMSMFDVGGNSNEKGLKGYIYGERGVWRPGDQIFLNFILEDKQKVLPENHPVIFELYTPENQLYKKLVKSGGENGFFDFRLKTETTAPTGNWLVKVKVGGNEYTKTIKIETIKPNRLKMKLDFGTEIIQQEAELNPELEIKWLHGAPGKNLRADVELELQATTTTFKEHIGYSFDDRSKTFYNQRNIIFDSEVDENGKTNFTTSISANQADCPGKLSARFKIRAFEKGGNFSTNNFSLPYSPFDAYVGLKVPEGKGWNGAVFSDKPIMVPIAALNPDGEPLAKRKVRVELYNVSWRWWWDRNSENDLASYVQQSSQHLLQSDTVTVTNGRVLYELNFKRRRWGRTFMRVIDLESGHSAGQTFYTTYSSWYRSSGDDNPGGAEMLSFSLDKKKYEVGEEVEVQLPASNKGKALVSIETGSKILQQFWVPLSETGNKFSFKSTSEMSPNAYVHISLIQEHANMSNDMPIRMYGVQAVIVHDPKTILSPQIDMPKSIEPEAEFTIKVKEEKGQKMTYTLAVVDDGLLDLTNFKTPNAWSKFYQKEALGVKTWDQYRDVIGAFTGEMAGLLALGGSDDAEGKEDDRSANRFKPVVLYLGPFTLEAGKEAKHVLKMPNYIGSVRTMIVAGNNGAYGSAEQTTPVKKPLMVLATLPRVLGPDEKVDLPITVFAMEDNIKKVTVKVTTNQMLKNLSESTQTITFDAIGDQVVNFPLQVAKSLGIGTMKVEVSSGKITATHEIEIQVRIPNTRLTNVSSGLSDANTVWSEKVNLIGMEGTNEVMVEVSQVPPINLEDRLQYLMRYPHGCIEQTTSSVFPQLYLKDLMRLDDIQRKEIKENIQAGIKRLKLFQLANGGLTYWPGESTHASTWGSNYAGHFLLEAKNQGYEVPSHMIDNWVRYQTSQANSWNSGSKGTNLHYYNSNQLIQAYRLFTLALAGKPALGAMNRMREAKDLGNASLWRLAAAYQLAGKSEVAKELVEESNTNIEPYKELSYSYGTQERDRAMILETLSLLNMRKDAKAIIDELSEKLSTKNWYSTQTTAFCLLSFSKFIGSQSMGADANFDLVIDGKSQNYVLDKPMIQIPVSPKDQSSISISTKVSGTLFTRLITSGIPLHEKVEKKETQLKIDVRYETLEGENINPKKLTQGTDFKAIVTITHDGQYRRDFKEMALSQIFPSGWEIRNMRMDQQDTYSGNGNFRYQDIRDDRVYTYFDILPRNSKTFEVTLHAAYLGSFYLPTIYCEAMYDNEINAREPGFWVEVVRPGE